MPLHDLSIAELITALQAFPDSSKGVYIIPEGDHYTTIVGVERDKDGECKLIALDNHLTRQ